MYKYFAFILLLAVLLLWTGCRPCAYQTIDLGPLPEEILAKVPYQNGRVYSFKHSAGHTVNFSTVRASRQEKTHLDDFGFYCNKEARIYVYEVNTTSLKPDYPIFNIRLDLCNETDSFYRFSAQIGSASFIIPVQAADTAYWPVTVADSLQIGNKHYKEVFKLKNLNDNWYHSDSIRVDSVFYNYDQGILLIKMTNREYYAIQE